MCQTTQLKYDYNNVCLNIINKGNDSQNYQNVCSVIVTTLNYYYFTLFWLLLILWLNSVVNFISSVNNDIMS